MALAYAATVPTREPPRATARAAHGFRDRFQWRTRRAAQRTCYCGARMLTRSLSRWWHVTVEGLENLPETGPVILAANHVSFLDSPLMMFLLPRQVRFLGKADYLHSWRTRFVFSAMGMIPLERDERRSALGAMRAALDIAERGEILGVFPEGTRSRDGNLHRGHTGLAWIAMRTGVCIVPVGISGTAQLQPPGARLPRLRGSCRISIGEPIAVDRFDSRDRRAQRALTDEVMFEIAQLSGQHYVDHYAEPPCDVAAATTKHRARTTTPAPLGARVPITAQGPERPLVSSLS